VTTDTIAAIATALGESGIAIVRVSGPEALRIVGRLARTPSPLESVATHSVHHAWLHGEDGTALDEVLLTVMRAPRTYTGEDVVVAGGAAGSGDGGLVLHLLEVELAQPRVAVDAGHIAVEGVPVVLIRAQGGGGHLVVTQDADTIRGGVLGPSALQRSGREEAQEGSEHNAPGKWRGRARTTTGEARGARSRPAGRGGPAHVHSAAPVSWRGAPRGFPHPRGRVGARAEAGESPA